MPFSLGALSRHVLGNGAPPGQETPQESLKPASIGNGRPTPSPSPPTEAVGSEKGAGPMEEQGAQGSGEVVADRQTNGKARSARQPPVLPPGT